jgi:DNA ligase (NAD+)
MLKRQMMYSGTVWAVFFFLFAVFSTEATAVDREAAIKKIRTLSSEINRHDYLYYVLGKPEISNQAYDKLYDELLRLEKEFPDLVLPDSPTGRVGSALDNRFAQVHHKVPMQSLNKCHSVKELLTWTTNTEKKVGMHLSFVVEEKIDGTGVKLTYKDGVLVKAATRGNSRTGYDVTHNVRTIKTVPLKLSQAVSITVRGEVFINKSDFSRLNQTNGIGYTSPRNLAAGALRRRHSEETAKVPLDIMVFEAVAGERVEDMNHADALVFLQKLGLKTNPTNRLFYDHEEMAKYIRKMLSRRDTRDYEIDGIILKVNEKKARQKLGRTARFPNWAMAYKFEPSKGETSVENIVVQVGRHGRITPVAILHSLRLDGATIRRTTLHNQDFINRLQLSVGDTVIVSRRGGVIPALESVVAKNKSATRPWQIPAECPACQTRLEKAGSQHFCLNWNCPEQVRARLVYFANRMNIRPIGPKTIDRLLAQKLIQNPEDLYKLDVETLENIQGLGARKFPLVKAALEQSKDQPFEAVLAAISVKGLGIGHIRKLKQAGFDSLEKITHASAHQLAQVEGIGLQTAEQIIKGFNPQLIRTAMALRALGLNI